MPAKATSCHRADARRSNAAISHEAVLTCGCVVKEHLPGKATFLGVKAQPHRGLTGPAALTGRSNYVMLTRIFVRPIATATGLCATRSEHFVVLGIVAQSSILLRGTPPLPAARFFAVGSCRRRY